MKKSLKMLLRNRELSGRELFLSFICYNSHCVPFLCRSYPPTLFLIHRHTHVRVPYMHVLVYTMYDLMPWLISSPLTLRLFGDAILTLQWYLRLLISFSFLESVDSPNICILCPLPFAGRS